MISSYGNYEYDDKFYSAKLVRKDGNQYWIVMLYAEAEGSVEIVRIGRSLLPSS